MRRILLAGLVLLGAPAALSAQAPQLILPKASPRATVSQTVGLTEISITYDRPGVNGRPIWGTLVPWDSVWRAGANENTVIAFSSPVRVGDTDVPAGRYGLHMIPSRPEWTVILSRQANAWGSFSYDPAEDLLRVKVTPTKGDFQSGCCLPGRPGTGHRDGDASVDTLVVPLAIQVDSKRVVADSPGAAPGSRPLLLAALESGRRLVRGERDQPAGGDHRADRSTRSTRISPIFGWRALLDKQEKPRSKALLQRSLAVASEADMNTYGYLLMGQDKVDSAVVVFQKNVKDYPKSWNAYDSLGEAYAKKGEVQRAIHTTPRPAKWRANPPQRRMDGGLAGLQHPG